VTKNDKLRKDDPQDNRAVEEVMSLDVDAHPVDSEVYTAETAVDLLNDSLEDEYEEEIGNYTQDEAIVEALANRQTLNTIENPLQKRLEEHHSEAPFLSGGDVDAAWDQANDAGSETVGGTASTPGQNDIDAMGKAMGITQERDKPLNIGEKRRRKDEERWELDPASAEDAP
jgi:hypothetical protein